jgi:hypothetical protein
MKLKTAVKTLLSDKGTSLGSKVEVVSFLRRYSLPTRPVTHYSCIGKSTDAIKRLLADMGMAEGPDFSVAASSFDEKFNQIRWTPKSAAIGTVVAELSAVPKIARLLDMAYVSLTHGEYPEKLVEALHDKGETHAKPGKDGGLNKNLLAVKLALRTQHIAKEVMNLKFTDERVATLKNIDVAYKSAMEYLSKRFKPDGTPLEGAPYALPLSVLELFVKTAPGVSTVEANPMNTARGGTLLFKTTERAIDLFRLVREDDAVVWNACLSAPLKFLWDAKGVSGSGNPLHGYYFRDMDTALKGRLDDKIGLFIGGNAELIHDNDGVDDNLSPALCISNHQPFWDYVLQVYRAAYAMDAGLSCQCKIGVSSKLSVWGATPECTQATDEYETTWLAEHGSPPENAPIMAMYGCFLGPDIDCSFSNTQSFISPCRKPIKLIQVNDKNIPDFSEKHLVRNEMGFEWFAMTHLDEDASDDPNNYHVYSRNTSDEDEDDNLVKNIKKLKTMFATATPASLAEVSSLTTSPFLTKQKFDRSMYDRYTPLSAFMEGMCVAIRKTCSPSGVRSEITKFLKTRDDGSRPTDRLITNVYSGLVTQLSPALGSPEDTGEVFPDPLGESRGIMCALGDTEEDKAKFTAFLNRLSGGKTMEQLNFAHRKPGTGRRHLLLIETNIDAEKALNAASTLERDVGTVFLQTIVLGNGTPACILDDGSVSECEDRRIYAHHDSLVECTKKYKKYLFGDRAFYKLPSGVYEAGYEGLSVTTRQDSFGRLVFIIDMSGDLALYSRLVFRMRCGFPLMTAFVKEKTFSGFRDNELCVTAKEWPSVNIADKIINRYLTNGSSDYHGMEDIRTISSVSGDSGPLFKQTVAMCGMPFRSPDRNWYLNRSTVIGCRNVFN